MQVKKLIRWIVRKILFVRPQETISDATLRHKFKILKKLDSRKYTSDDIKKKLQNIGLKTGDQVVVHCSWRALYGFKGTPNDLIDVIIDIIGEEGTLLMPATALSKDLLDIKNTPSTAGVMTEVFRLRDNVIRSENLYFSVSATGKNARYLLKDHIDCEYAFDENSPYSRLSQIDGKLLLIGLGKKPHKITPFHCAAYFLSGTELVYKNMFGEKKVGTIITNDGTPKKVTFIDRKHGYQNNKRLMSKIFQETEKSYVCLSGVDIYLCRVEELINNGIDAGKQGELLYKKKKLI